MRIAALFVLLAGATACAQTYDASTLGVPVTMASAAGSPAEGTRFRTDAHPVYGFWGLLSIASPNLRKVLNRQLIGASGVADLRIKTRSRWSDILIGVLTAGLVVPRTVTFEGVIVQP